MRNKILKNFFYQASYQVLLIALPIVTIPIVSKALGPDGLGIWNYINSIVNYFILVGGLGLANYGVREIALVKKSRRKLSQKFWELEFFNAFFSLFALIVYILFSLLTDYPSLFLIQGLAVLSVLLDISWMFSGLEDFKTITVSNFMVKILSFIFIVVFINESTDLFKYFFIQSLSILLSQIIPWFFLKNKISFILPSLKDIWKHFRPALSFFIAKVSMTIYTNLNKTILGLMTTMTVVGFYSNAIQLITVGGSIIGALNTVMIPRMTDLFGERDEKAMINLLNKTMNIILFFTIAMSFGIIATNEKLIPWFFGTAFLPIKNYVPLLAPVLVFQSIQTAIAGQYLIPKGEMKSYNISVVVSALLSVIFNLVFIPRFEIYGAILGTIVAQGSLCLIRSFILMRQTSFRFDFITIGKYLFSGLAMVVIIKVFTNRLPSNILTTCFQVAIGAVVYFSLTSVFRANPISGFVKENYFNKK